MLERDLKKKEKPYSNKQSIFINVEGNVKEALEEICYKERKTLTAKLQEMINEEIRKKEIGLTANPIGLTYNITEQHNSNHKLISLFANYSTSKDVYHKLREDRAELEESRTLDRYFRSGLEGNRQYMANLLRK